MDMKAFGLGATCGILASVLVFLLVGRDQDEAVKGPSAQESATTAGVQEESAANPGEGRGSEVDLRKSARSADAAASDSDELDQAEEEGNDPLPWPPSRAARAQEAKDAGWSHYMEQTLTRYLATHPKAAQFDFRSVDCRTTFCEVQAVGVDESAAPVWTQVTYDVRQQPWSEFDMYGTDEIRSRMAGHCTERPFTASGLSGDMSVLAAAARPWACGRRSP